VPAAAWLDRGIVLPRVTVEALHAVELLARVRLDDTAAAALRVLRQRMDGCGARPGRDDWIVDCAAQTRTRALVDLLIGNLSR
jgi:hypothetical protein